MKAKHLLCFLSVTISASSYAAQESPKKFTPPIPIDFGRFQGAHTYYGLTRIENQKLDKLSVTGSARLEGVTVSGATAIMGPAKIKDSTLNGLHVAGPLDARKVSLKTLEVIGPVRFERVVVEEKVIITGPLFADESHFKGPISIITDKMTLDQSTAKDILIHKNSNWLKKSQRVTLTNKTVVKGNITFEAGNGIVYIKKGAILDGEVKGGKKVVQENKKT